MSSLPDLNFGRSTLSGSCEHSTPTAVDFVLIGGIACLMHGASRVTVDADVVAASNQRNLRRLFVALEDLGAAVLVSARRREMEDGEPWEIEHLRRGPEAMAEVEAWHFTTDAGALDIVFTAAGVGT